MNAHGTANIARARISRVPVWRRCVHDTRCVKNVAHAFKDMQKKKVCANDKKRFSDIVCVFLFFFLVCGYVRYVIRT